MDVALLRSILRIRVPDRYGSGIEFVENYLLGMRMLLQACVSWSTPTQAFVWRLHF